MKEWFENKTVSLVGNATSLFDHNFGEEIDSHDVVVRLNKAAMLINNMNSEKTHGKRTDVWMFWSVAEYYKYFDTIDQSILLMHNGHQFRNNTRIGDVDFVYPEEYYALLKPLAGTKKNPTTGFIAMDYIMKCNPKEMRVYGFDFKKTPTHTDPNRVKEKRCPHNYDIEEKYAMEHIFSKSNAFLRTHK